MWSVLHSALRFRLVLDQLTLCGSFTARLSISSEQSEKALVQRLEVDLSRPKLEVQNLESFGHELELTIPDYQKQMK